MYRFHHFVDFVILRLLKSREALCATHFSRKGLSWRNHWVIPSNISHLGLNELGLIWDGLDDEMRICSGVGQHKKLQNCKVMVANTSMDTDKIKIYGARVKVESFEAVQDLEEAERQKMKQKVGREYYTNSLYILIFIDLYIY